jgi:serine/threonine-protein kinase
VLTGPSAPPLREFLQPGHAFGDRYKIIRLLGSGGMAAVYQAWDELLAISVALKLIRVDADLPAGRQHLEARFKRELILARQITHPNVVRIHDLGEIDGMLYLTMEYVQGADLATLLAQERGMAIPRALSLARQIAAGLSAVHEGGVVHLDLKPSNVMVDVEGRARLMDFGIARSTAIDTVSTAAVSLIGTLSYMAPEQARGEPTGPYTDVYAFGLMLYEMLAGRRASTIREGGLKELIERLEIGPPPLKTVYPELPPPLERIVSRCLAPSPAARFATAVQLLAELENLDEQGQSRSAFADNPLARWWSIFKRIANPFRRRGDRFKVEPDEPGQVADTPALEEPNTTPAALPPAAAPKWDAETVYVRQESAAVQPIADPTIELFSVARETRESSAGQVRLVVTRSPDSRLQAQVLPLGQAMVSIGRDAASDISVDDQLLSRQHACIERGPAGFVVRDGGSSNGTFLNGRRLHANVSEPLPFGSTIQVGETIFTLTHSREAALGNLSGIVLGSRYELTRLLHESGRGWIYAARDRRLDAEKAVKIIDPALMAFAGYREQFNREASMARTLQHAHICRLVDRGEERLRLGGRDCEISYLCLDMVSGGNLKQRIHDKRITLADIGLWMDHLADALDTVHRRGIVHGDVKPSAILFDDEGCVYLTDFAYAQRLSGGDTGPMFATPSYVGPEIWEHRALSPRSDQFALAAVAYEAIAGAPPFLGQENPAIRRRNFARGSVPVHEEAGSYRADPVPGGVSEVFTRALMVAPEERFETCSEFASSLGAALRGARPTSRAPNVFLSYRRAASAGWANYLADKLRERGIVPFVDVQAQDGALQFPTRLANAIDKSDVFLCLLDAHTLDSAWVVEEIRHAHRRNKPMVPIFQEDFDPNRVPPGTDTAVDALLMYQAVYLLDRRNVYANSTAESLVERIHDAISQRT